MAIPVGTTDLNCMGVGRFDPEMFGEHGGQHDVRHRGGVAAQEAVDVRALQSGIGDRQFGGTAHQIQRRGAFVLAERCQPNAGDVAHLNTTSQ